MKGKFALSLLLLIVIALLCRGSSYAYFHQQQNIHDSQDVGEVLVKPDIYFFSNNKRIDPVEVDIGNDITKKNVYHVNVSNVVSDYHINKLRVDFLVDSNIDTYFRIKLIDTLTLSTTRSDGRVVELSLPNEGIEYTINDKFFFDPNSDYYYYTEAVKKIDEPIRISFIIPGLDYGTRQPQYQIQFGIEVQAVQGHRGPLENWSMSTPPWDSGGEW